MASIFNRKSQQFIERKISLKVNTQINTRDDLARIYTPGVAKLSQEIVRNPQALWDLTSKGNWVAVVTDGSSVLGLGNIGAKAAVPVMEGKALLFKQFADVDAFPICLETQNPDEVVHIIKVISPIFGAINMEDIAAPNCFYIEKRLREELDIPVFHDDQHGTAIVVLAGLINALKLQGKSFSEAKIVICGAGAAGIAITKMLLLKGVKNIIVVDSIGIVSRDRTDLNAIKKEVAENTNPENIQGDLAKAMNDRDVFIGISRGGLLTEEHIQSMAPNPIIFALANPDPEIMPDEAKKAGASIVATGRSDFPNQINNVLVFPGLLRGVLDCRVKIITDTMKFAAADALANYVNQPGATHLLPDPLDKNVAQVIAQAVCEASPEPAKQEAVDR